MLLNCKNKKELPLIQEEDNFFHKKGLRNSIFCWPTRYPAEDYILNLFTRLDHLLSNKCSAQSSRLEDSFEKYTWELCDFSLKIATISQF